MGETAPRRGRVHPALVRDRHTTTLREPPPKYAELTQPTTKTVGTIDNTDTTTSVVGGLDVGLEAELASFASLLGPTPYPTVAGQEVIPGQLDLLQSLHPTDSNNSKEHL